MRFNPLLPLLLIGGSLLFHWLFWQQTAGLNVPLWTLFTIGAIGFRNRTVFQSPRALLVMGASLFSSFMVVMHHSLVGLIACAISYPIMLGLSFQPQHKTVLFSFFTTVAEIARVPLKVIERFPMPKGKQLQVGKLLYAGRVWILPLLVLGLFYALYMGANPIFEGLNEAALLRIDNVWRYLTEQLSAASMMVFILGLLLMLIVAMKGGFEGALRLEQSFRERVLRKRSQPHRPGDPKPYQHKTLALKREYRSAFYMLLLINILLLLVNGIDVQTVWINFEPAGAHNLSQFVHEGTWLLIASIAAAMLVVLVIFRGSLNFWKTDQKLRILGNAWLIQNGILALSVGIRNIHYLQEMGLSQKRIGVFIFLLLVLIGLVTMALKIANKRSLFYLLKVNSWAAFTVLVAATAFNWDAAIVRYNLSHQATENVDLQYLISLSQTTLPIIAEYPAVLDQLRPNLERTDNYWPWFYNRARPLFERVENHEFQSWNYAEQRAVERLEAMNLTRQSIRLKYTY